MRGIPRSRRLVLLSVVVAIMLASAVAVDRRTDPPTSGAAGTSGPTAGPRGSVVVEPTLDVGAASPVVSAPPPSRTAAPAPAATADAGGPGSMAALVGALPVLPEQGAGYSRTLFRHWIDADGNGCDTRREVLLAEAVVAPTIGAGCRLSGGEWISAYDGLVIDDAKALDVDHVVALAEAWASGAHAWTPERRRAYANDLGVPWALIAVSAASNRSKRDRDPAEWLPPLPAARCQFLADWVAVKLRWQLAVDQAERATLTGLAPGCSAAAVPSIPPP